MKVVPTIGIGIYIILVILILTQQDSKPVMKNKKVSVMKNWLVLILSIMVLACASMPDGYGTYTWSNGEYSGENI